MQKSCNEHNLNNNYWIQANPQTKQDIITKKPNVIMNKTNLARMFIQWT